MFRDRDVRRSAMDWVREKFENPPADTLSAAYTVYNEDQLRQAQKGTLTPTNRHPSSPTPCVFLLDAYMRPEKMALPEIVVEIPDIYLEPFEIGNRSGGQQQLLIHIFGRSRGERDDLASFLARQIQTGFSVYAYTSGSAAFVETALVDPLVWIEQTQLNADELRREGTLDLWATIHVRFQLKH